MFRIVLTVTKFGNVINGSINAEVCICGDVCVLFPLISPYFSFVRTCIVNREEFLKHQKACVLVTMRTYSGEPCLYTRTHTPTNRAPSTLQYACR